MTFEPHGYSDDSFIFRRISVKCPASHAGVHVTYNSFPQWHFTELSPMSSHSPYWRKLRLINVFQDANIQLMHSQLSTSDLDIFSPHSSKTFNLPEINIQKEFGGFGCNFRGVVWGRACGSGHTDLGKRLNWIEPYTHDTSVCISGDTRMSSACAHHYSTGVSFLVLKLYYTFVGCPHWEKLADRSTELTVLFSPS